MTDFPTPAVSRMAGAIAFPHLGASTEESEENCAVMAAHQLADYLENGNIANAVNYAGVSLGMKKGQRLGVFHHNVKNMIAQIASILGEKEINIGSMASQGRGDYAYTLMELDAPAAPETTERISQIPGVYRLRVID